MNGDQETCECWNGVCLRNNFLGFARSIVLAIASVVFSETTLAATNAQGTPVLLDNGESFMGVWETSENGPHNSWSHDSRDEPGTAHAQAKANYRQPYRHRITLTLSA